MKTTFCNTCSYEIKNCNFVKHTKSCNGLGPRSKRSKIEIPSELVCVYCSKECFTANSHRNHERCCKLNPNRNYTNGMTGKVSHKRGKTKDTDESIKRQAESFKKKIELGLYVPHRTPHTTECKERISEIMQFKMGNRYTASKRIEYKGIKFESSWEHAVAVSLDEHKINWTRPSPLLYTDDIGQQRRYYPDFYLPDFNVYLDPKNDYVKKLDAAKISAVQKQNSIHIILLGKDQLTWSVIEKLIGDSSNGKFTDYKRVHPSSSLGSPPN